VTTAAKEVQATDRGGRPRFLVFAYACEPDKGSEPGAGWIWSRMLARIGQVWVITRANNREVIERYLPGIPEKSNLRFVYVDLSSRARFWKRGPRGARLYYLLWQVAALRQARNVCREVEFDAAWHLTWANAWMGSVAGFLPVPFIYGPVGGGVDFPWRFASIVGFRGTLYEVGRSLARWAARYGNPLARLAWRKASLILAQNPETRSWLPARHRGKTLVFPNAVLEANGVHLSSEPPRQSSTALFAGRLVPWKGLALALRALALLPDWRLLIIGKGPDERRLRRLARRLGVDTRVDFLGWMPRQGVQRLMHRADLFLFPSLHDDAPFVIAEALANGLPVVCVARGGPPLIAGGGIVTTSIRGLVADLAKEMSIASGTTPGPFPDMPSRTRLLAETLVERLSWLVQTKADQSPNDHASLPEGAR
jgi:glycosyltransferase involved in cell wall biosynthesis